jgi:hypothetical protein
MLKIAKRALYAVAMGITAGVIIATLLQTLPPGLSAQALLWAFYEWAGWWWWGIAVVLSFIGMGYMFTLSAPKTRWGVTTRIVLLSGFICHGLSWGNNGFGPFASMLILLAERKRYYNPGPSTFSQKAYSLLVER